MPRGQRSVELDVAILDQLQGTAPGLSRQSIISFVSLLEQVYNKGRRDEMGSLMDRINPRRVSTREAKSATEAAKRGKPTGNGLGKAAQLELKMAGPALDGLGLTADGRPRQRAKAENRGSMEGVTEAKIHRLVKSNRGQWKDIAVELNVSLASVKAFVANLGARKNKQILAEAKEMRLEDGARA